MKFWSELFFLISVPLRLFFSHEDEAIKDVLHEDEEVIESVRGFFNKSLGLLISTNHRVIFIDKKPFWGIKVVDFYNKKISSVVYETFFLTGSMVIAVENDKATIEYVPKKQLLSFAESLKRRIYLSSEAV